jgi:hypothetical protein
VVIWGKKRRHCAAVPCASSVGPARLMPTRLTSWAAPLRAYSELNSATSTADAPRPPYSTGQSIPTQPAAASFACQARPWATASARSSVAGAVSALAVNQARTSAAKRSSASVSDRSTGAA